MSNFSRKIKRSKKNKDNYTKEEILALQLPEYHTFVFAKLLEKNREILEKNYVSEFHISFFKNRIKKEVSGEKAWSLILEYSEYIEIKLKEILEKHSISFWIQMYRRIGLGIVSDLNRLTDEITLYQLREITELAILKFSKLNDEDIQNTNEISDKDVLGGLFKQYYHELLEEKYDDIYRQTLAKNHQVITDFHEQDYIDIYIVERFAHEYWWSTAVMRSIGKGSSIYLDSFGIVQEKRTNELEMLLRSYDNRIKDEAFTTSNIGISFFQGSNNFQMPCPQYNYKNHTMKKVDIFYRMFNCNFELDLTPNFYWAMINTNEYIETYKFLDEKLKKKYNFTVSQIAIYLTLLHLNSFTNTFNLQEKKLKLIPHLNLYQRAYLFINNIQDINESILTLYEGFKTKLNIKDVIFNNEVVNIISDYLTLDSNKKQGYIALWSGGPKYTFIKSNGIFLVDFVSSAKILQNLFFGIKVDNEKGTIFEENFRNYVKENNLNLLDYRKIENFNSEEREIDLAIRVNNVLFLIECRAIEKPLDFEIGKIKTIQKRKKEIDSKISQVLSLSDFIMKNKKGKNYDLSWAEEVVPIVVTPFIEWIDSFEERYWITKDTPRVLNPEETISLIKTVVRENK